METITKEVYRTYLEIRIEKMEKLMKNPLDLRDHLKVCDHLDYLMNQLYLLDNEPEEQP